MTSQNPDLSGPDYIYCEKTRCRLHRLACKRMRELGRYECRDCEQVKKPTKKAPRAFRGGSTQPTAPKRSQRATRPQKPAKSYPSQLAHRCPNCRTIIKNYSKYCKPCGKVNKLYEAESPEWEAAMERARENRRRGKVKVGRKRGYKPSR